MKLVLLPGLDGTGRLFGPLLKSLPADVETIVISYPSNGKLNYKDLCDYVIERLPESADFVLLGESFSGAIAYEVSLRKPGYLKSIIIVAGFLDTPHPMLLGISKLLPVSMILSMHIPDFIIRQFLLGREASAELIDEFRRSLKSASPGVLAYRLNLIANMKVHTKTSDTRTLYIQASDDWLVPERCVSEFTAVMSDISVVAVAGPHFILQANPVAAARIIYDELNISGR